MLQSCLMSSLPLLFNVGRLTMHAEIETLGLLFRHSRGST
jgi:hypothetical protein